MNNYNRQISEWIIEKRNEKGLTQGQLGEKIGVTKTAVHYWESGKRSINADTFISICKALNADPYELIQTLMRQNNETS